MARLSNEDLTDLAIKAQGGDEEATLRLVEGCKGIVRAAVKKVLRTGSTVEEADLMAVGTLAVLERLHEFDPARGNFVTFIFPYVGGDVMSEAGRLYSGMEVPKMTLARYRQAMTEANGEAAHARELVQDMDPTTFDSLHRVVTGVWSLSGVDPDQDVVAHSLDGPATYLDMPEQTVIESDERERIAEALDHLSEREREVLELVYGLTGDAPMSDVEASKVLGVAASTVCRARNRALKKLMALLDGAR